MPTYEFKCPDGHQFERFFKTISGARNQEPCPTCGKPGARMLSAGAGLLFKGSGFYLTDYGKNAHRGIAPEKGGGGSGSGESSTSSEKSESSSAKSEGKSEAKTEAKPKSESKSESSGAKAPAADAKPKSSKPKSE